MDRPGAIHPHPAAPQVSQHGVDALGQHLVAPHSAAARVAVVQAEAQAERAKLELVRAQTDLEDSQIRHRDTTILLERLSNQNGELRSELNKARADIAELVHHREECELKHGWLLHTAAAAGVAGSACGPPSPPTTATAEWPPSVSANSVGGAATGSLGFSNSSDANGEVAALEARLQAAMVDAECWQRRCAELEAASSSPYQRLPAGDAKNERSLGSSAYLADSPLDQRERAAQPHEMLTKRELGLRKEETREAEHQLAAAERQVLQHRLRALEQDLFSEKRLCGELRMKLDGRGRRAPPGLEGVVTSMQRAEEEAEVAQLRRAVERARVEARQLTDRLQVTEAVGKAQEVASRHEALRSESSAIEEVAAAKVARDAVDEAEKLRLECRALADVGGLAHRQREQWEHECARQESALDEARCELLQLRVSSVPSVPKAQSASGAAAKKEPVPSFARERVPERSAVRPKAPLAATERARFNTEAGSEAALTQSRDHLPTFGGLR